MLVEEAHQYNGFNLILADLSSNSMVYISNRPKSNEPIKVEDVSPGIHVLSNAKLDSPWPKVERLGFNLNKMLKSYDQDEVSMKDMIKILMRDTTKADETELPHICSLEWEYNLSSIFVEVDTPVGYFGTRSTAALTVKTDGEACFYETYLENNMWKEKTHSYCIQKLQQP